MKAIGRAGNRNEIKFVWIVIISIVVLFWLLLIMLV